MRKLYFDNAATTPTDPGVIEAMKPYFFEKFGNASSPHGYGREANKALEDARADLADFIGAAPEEIVFTSGGTESNNTALIGLARAQRQKGKHIIVSKIEHHSILEPVEYLAQESYQITYADVNKEGVVDPKSIKEALCDQTIGVCVMHANNEIGTIQPIEQVSAITKEAGVPLILDAVQTVGHIPVNVNQLGADLLSLSAHKFYGPKGIGALYIRNGTKINRYLMGGDQEKERRASTQNVAGAVGLAKAVELARSQMTHEMETQQKLRNRIIDYVTTNIENARLNGHPQKRLPNNAHFSFSDIQGEALLMSLDMAGIATSMGSACTSGALEPSHTLQAIGLNDELAYGSLRLSIGRWTTPEDVDFLIEQLPKSIEQLRAAVR